jgi:hypothetical protein
VKDLLKALFLILLPPEEPFGENGKVPVEELRRFHRERHRFYVVVATMIWLLLLGGIGYITWSSGLLIDNSGFITYEAASLAHQDAENKITNLRLDMHNLQTTIALTRGDLLESRLLENIRQRCIAQRKGNPEAIRTYTEIVLELEKKYRAATGEKFTSLSCDELM